LEDTLLPLWESQCTMPRTASPVRPDTVCAAAVVLTGDPGAGGGRAGLLPGGALPVVAIDGATVVVRWADGAKETVRL
jgi:hypothetical protein